MAELGVCYYPEHWPETIWADDALRMVEMGLSWVRIGEFAWSRIEPQPGEYDFDWLDSAVDTLGSAGLKIIMSTPTATPPRWMLDRHPEMLAWDRDGRPRGFGSRRHYDFSHAGYLEDCKRIAKKLGERYGRHSEVQGWQIDNEYGCHDTTLSYGPVARTAFHNWLARKYNNIVELNARWGNVFWSMEYNSFDQIDLPNMTVTEPNPAHVMDFRRFSSDAVVAFNKAQTDVLRPLTDSPLIHNYMGRVTDFDHFDVGEDLDIASWDSYPLGFLEDRSDQSEAFKLQHMRCGDPDFQAFHHDLYRAVGKGRLWIMEQQPGPVNWAPHNPIPAAGMVKVWALEAIAHGAEVVCFFRWRQAPFAQEQMHAGLLRPDGELSAGGKDVVELAKELQLFESLTAPTVKVGLIFDYQSQWAWEVQPQDARFDYFRLLYDVYKGLRRAGVAVDILPPDSIALSNYDIIFAPGLFSMTEEMIACTKNTNTRLVLGPRSGSRTPDFRIPSVPPPTMAGLKVVAVDTLREGKALELSSPGCVHIWREILESDWTVEKTTTDGLPAVVSREGNTYWAGWPDDTALDDWLSDALLTSGITPIGQNPDERRYCFQDRKVSIDYLGARVKCSPAD